MVGGVTSHVPQSPAPRAPPAPLAEFSALLLFYLPLAPPPASCSILTHRSLLPLPPSLSYPQFFRTSPIVFVLSNFILFSLPVVNTHFSLYSSRSLSLLHISLFPIYHRRSPLRVTLFLFLTRSPHLSATLSVVSSSTLWLLSLSHSLLLLFKHSSEFISLLLSRLLPHPPPPPFSSRQRVPFPHFLSYPPLVLSLPTISRTLLPLRICHFLRCLTGLAFAAFRSSAQSLATDISLYSLCTPPTSS